MSLLLQITSQFERISSQELLFITKHLAVMIKAGIPLTEALGVLGDQAHTSTTRKVILHVKKDVENGTSLSKSLARHPHIFNPFFTTLIEVSEESGTLEENLEFLSVQLAKSNSLRTKIQSALLYPGLVITSTLVMGGFISLFILPQLITFFESFNTQLPLPTRILLAIANFSKNYGVATIVGMLVGGLFFLALVQTPKLKIWWHRLLLHLPILGKFIAAAQLALFARNLGILMGSGVPVLLALKTTAHTLSNVQFQSHVLTLHDQLASGTHLAEALKKAKYREFPTLVASMINVGEKTGKLDETLLYLADFYEEEIDTMAKNLSTLLEPTLLLTIGLVVGFVAIAIISPIYELTSSLQR
jgi:type IV pilus assembly protein PilC